MPDNNSWGIGELGMKKLIALMLVFVSGVAPAATIFSQTPTITSAVISDADATIYQANDFSLSSADTVRSVTWRGIGTPSAAADSFTISFYSDSSGAPSSALQSFTAINPVSRIDTGLDFSPEADIYEYTANLGSGISLSGSTNYWLSIYNDTSGDTATWFWVGAFSGNNFNSNDLVSWSGPIARENYFTLSNVPIPAAVWLFGSGLGLLGWMKRKQIG